MITTLVATRPGAEVLAWALADMLIATKLGWVQPLPLLMTQRNGTAFRTEAGRGRIGPEDPAFATALSLALVAASQNALNSANALARRNATLLAVAPKLRSKGAATILYQLSDKDALLASAPGSGLSRWAATRLFERLHSFGAVRELSGRTSF
ncbi:DUF1403 family protein [Pseudochrobactrum sp. MP213Fo]|uniref:DUF1403 family protein n=1 Tax=Pseudochrobactrum sp. MP213Fo TaxID=3022250 RepID=UPI003BA17816